MKTFKNHFGIAEDTKIEFLDFPLDGDLEVFIDPFLIANNRDSKLLDDVYQHTKKFLEKLNRHFIVKNDRVNGLIFLDFLHEPNEYHLGYSPTNKGSAISNTKAEVIFDALRNNRFARDAGITITNEAHSVLLLVTGIGQDIMSDTIANVCRDIFAKFTQEQCLKHRISTENFVRHYFDPTSGKWEYATFSLPVFLGKPIILLPKKIISAPRSYVNHYNYFVAGNYISKDILSGKISVDEKGDLVKTLKDGTKTAIIRRIYKAYSKPKSEIIQFVRDYQGSLDEFLDYAKIHYPAVDLSGLN